MFEYIETQMLQIFDDIETNNNNNSAAKGGRENATTANINSKNETGIDRRQVQQKEYSSTSLQRCS